MITYEIYFSGKVKNVGFEKTFLKIARHKNLVGFIEMINKNLAKSIIQNKSREEILKFLSDIDIEIKRFNRNVDIKDFKINRVETERVFKTFYIKRKLDIKNTFEKMTKSILNKNYEKLNISKTILITLDDRDLIKKNNLLELKSKIEKNVFNVFKFVKENTFILNKNEIILNSFSNISLSIFINYFLKNKLFHNYNFKFYGEFENLNEDFLKKLKTIENLSNYKSNLKITLLINYNSNMEIIRAIRNIPFNDIKSIDENSFSKFLCLGKKIDLVVKTESSNKINFPVFQTNNSKLIISKKSFLDFREKDIYEILKEN